MHPNVHAVGMFIRYAAKASKSNDFYEKVLQLPLLRKSGNADIYWGGEAAIFEVVYVADKDVVAEPDPAHAAAIPVFRVHGLDALLARLVAAGATVTAAKQRAFGREACVQDSDGYWVGLRERAPDAPLPQDVEARRRHVRGETYNPGCKSMPADVQEMGWMLRRVDDLPKMTAFYRDVLGLVQVGDEDGHVLFDSGDNTIVELAPGGTAVAPPTHRYHTSSATILRVGNVAAVRAALRAAGAHVVTEQLPLHWADLIYFSDPEGTVIGAEQAYHPGTYAPENFILAENLESERRAREHAASLATHG